MDELNFVEIEEELQRYEESFLNCLQKMKARNKKKYKEQFYAENYIIREELEEYEF